MFTRGWGFHGCLGRENEECVTLPTVVETLKAVQVSAGQYTSLFIIDNVIIDNVDVYSFGLKGLGLQF